MRCVILLVLIAACTTAGAQTWQQAVLVTPPDHHTKSLDLCGAATGGCHFTFRNAVTSALHYRRYTRDGAWSPVRTIKSGNFMSHTEVAESGGGALWVVWEDWGGGSPNCHAAQSNSGGVSWGEYQLSTWTGSAAGVKLPSIARLGGPYSHEVMATFCNTADNKMYFNRFDGFRFLGLSIIPGGGCGSFYWSSGSAHSAANGGVYRTYGHGGNVFVNFFNGTSWEGETQLKFDGIFYAWPNVAAAASGHVMVIWERDERTYSRVFIPGQGWQPTVDFSGHLPSVTEIADRPEFYLTYVKMPEQDRIMGRRWSNGAWSNEVRVSMGIPNAFSVQNIVCSDRWGSLYCVFEYWGAGQPQTYFSSTRDYDAAQTPTPLNTPPVPATATITPTFTNTATRTFTLTPTRTNTPRNLSPTPTPSNTPIPVQPNMVTW